MGDTRITRGRHTVNKWETRGEQVGDTREKVGQASENERVHVTSERLGLKWGASGGHEVNKWKTSGRHY